MNLFKKKNNKQLKALQNIVKIRKDVLSMRSLEHQTIINNYLSDVEDRIRQELTNGDGE